MIMMKFLCHVRLGPATLRDDSKYCRISHLWSPRSLCTVRYSMECTGCRVHHLNMITSYIQTLVREGGRVRTGPTVQSVLEQIISKMIGSIGEDVLIRQGGLSFPGFLIFCCWVGKFLQSVRTGRVTFTTKHTLSHQTGLESGQLQHIYFSFPSPVMHHINVIVIKCELTVLM